MREAKDLKAPWSRAATSSPKDEDRRVILSRPRCRKARSRFDGFVREAKDLGFYVQHPSCIFPGTIV